MRYHNLTHVDVKYMRDQNPASMVITGLKCLNAAIHGP
jgi:hypothetical protein